jgi:RimJ/RimL family protein N-acetyltransferase
LKSDPLTVRPANASDEEDLLRWRNDIESREQSRDSELISTETHNAWFNQILNSPNNYVYIATLSNGTKIGQVRFDRLAGEKSTFEVSISMAPEFRGRNLSVELLLAAEAEFCPNHTPLTLHAFVKTINAPSQHLFASASYTIDPAVVNDGNWWSKEIND